MFFFTISCIIDAYKSYLGGKPMAIITISRQVAALGDEIAAAAAKELGYSFITRKQIEKRIVELGFDVKHMTKFDEKKPGFFASLSKSRDEYLNYLQYAVLESALENNCILIGRGAFVILEDIPNHIPLRFVSPDNIRIERLMKEFNWNEKLAQTRLEESAANRQGFHKSFFNVDNEDASNYLLTLNTGMISLERAVSQIKDLARNFITPEQEEKGTERIKILLKAQGLVNQLLFEYKLNINMLHADVDDSCKVITLNGIADSNAIVERASSLAVKLAPDFQVKPKITVVQDFKN